MSRCVVGTETPNAQQKRAIKVKTTRVLEHFVAETIKTNKKTSGIFPTTQTLLKRFSGARATDIKSLSRLWA
jgi:hypothetical protein